MTKAFKVLLVALCGAALLAACGNSDDTSSTTTSSTHDMGTMASHDMSGMPSGTAMGATIEITGNKFTVPASVKPGEKITIKNNDTVEHSVTADSGGTFDVEVEPGETETLTAPTAGSYAFHCTYHPSMTGTLVVS